ARGGRAVEFGTGDVELPGDGGAVRGHPAVDRARPAVLGREQHAAGHLHRPQVDGPAAELRHLRIAHAAGPQAGAAARPPAPGPPWTVHGLRFSAVSSTLRATFTDRRSTAQWPNSVTSGSRTSLARRSMLPPTVMPMSRTVPLAEHRRSCMFPETVLRRSDSTSLPGWTNVLSVRCTLPRMATSASRI